MLRMHRPRPLELHPLLRHLFTRRTARFNHRTAHAAVVQLRDLTAIGHPGATVTPGPLDHATLRAQPKTGDESVVQTVTRAPPARLSRAGESPSSAAAEELSRQREEEEAEGQD